MSERRTDSFITVESCLPEDWSEVRERQEVHHDIRRAFTRRPIVLAPKWLYDDHGSDLFDQITRLAEYYPTEAERSILEARADEIAALTGADTIVELGSGTSDKTRTLLDAFYHRGQLGLFVPLDVSEGTLVDAAEMLASRYDGLGVHALVGDFTRHLSHLPERGRRMVAFLGGTIGNFFVEERRAFLEAVARQLRDDEWLLLGVDLVKPLDRIVTAYNDEQRLTERFIKNSLAVLNARLDADFDLDVFDYVPFWDGREERVDMRLRASEPTHARIGALELDVSLEAGEEIRVEISTKFRPELLVAEMAEVGLSVEKSWTDERGDFSLILARRGES